MYTQTDYSIEELETNQFSDAYLNTLDIDELSDDADELADSLSGKKPVAWDIPQAPLCWSVFEKREGLYNHKTHSSKLVATKYDYDSSVFSDEEEEVSADSLSIHTTTTSVLSVDSKY